MKFKVGSVACQIALDPTEKIQKNGAFSTVALRSGTTDYPSM